jgi:SAM-dependent methyltransferase
MMQLGGKGIHAVKLLLGGAAEAWVVTPMLGEIQCAIALAEAAGVAERLRFAVAVGEELPFADNAFDGIYCGGCLHHMQTEIALPEISRVLSPGGAFAAVEPWKAPLYTLGTTLFGKRERGAFCRPLTKSRIAPLKDTFVDHAVIQHGTLTRYPLLALGKLGLSSSMQTVWRLNRMDDALCSLLPGFRQMGSSVVCLGRKAIGTKQLSKAA